MMWGAGEARGRIPSGRIREGLSTVAGALADSPVVAVIHLRIAVGWGAKGRGRPANECGQPKGRTPRE
jgi:hypothetical protein